MLFHMANFSHVPSLSFPLPSPPPIYDVHLWVCGIVCYTLRVVGVGMERRTGRHCGMRRLKPTKRCAAQQYQCMHPLLDFVIANADINANAKRGGGVQVRPGVPADCAKSNAIIIDTGDRVFKLCANSAAGTCGHKRAAMTRTLCSAAGTCGRVRAAMTHTHISFCCLLPVCLFAFLFCLFPFLLVTNPGRATLGVVTIPGAESGSPSCSISHNPFGFWGG